MWQNFTAIGRQSLEIWRSEKTFAVRYKAARY